LDQPPIKIHGKSCELGTEKIRDTAQNPVTGNSCV